MFDCGLGTSLTSLLDYMTTRDFFQPLRDSEIKTFELAPQLFFYDYDGSFREEFKTLLKETGKQAISYHIPFLALDDLSSPDELSRTRALSRFRAHYKAVQEFGCKYLILHPSTEIRTNVKSERDERIGQLRKSLQEMESEIRDLNVKLALEFLPRLCLGNTLSDMEQILDGMNEELFGVCFDVNHIMSQYTQIPEMTRKLGKRLFTTHISDYNGIDECHWLPGHGVIDWKGFVEALKDIDYRGPFNYEIRHQEGNAERRVRVLEENFKFIKSLA